MNVLEVLKQVLFASLYILAISLVWLVIAAVIYSIGNTVKRKKE